VTPGVDETLDLTLALAGFHDPEADTLDLLRRLVDVIRPCRRGDPEVASRYEAVLVRLEGDTVLRMAFRARVLHFLATRRLVTFFTDSGILPGTGFFSEWTRILGNRVLPEVPDTRRFRDCLHVIYDRHDDWQWQESIPTAYVQRLWGLLLDERELATVDWAAVRAQILDAVLLLAHRVSGLGVEGELLRVSRDFEDYLPAFVSLSEEATAYVDALRRPEGAASGAADAAQLIVIADQCRTVLEKVRKRARKTGTSLRLSYILARAEQSLERLVGVVGILHETHREGRSDETVGALAGFLQQAFTAENRRNSLRHDLRRVTALLAACVTEHAAQSGEHYIAATRSEYGKMWRSAAGAGLLIPAMAMLKILVAGVHPSLFVEAVLFSLIYGLGFVAIYLLGLTVATKQPAMTAQTLAGLLGEIRPTRQADVERVVDVSAAVCRSQLAAIAGNVMIAFPVALALGATLASAFGPGVITEEKAAHLLHDLDPLGWTAPHAMIAGVYLFLSGLISGYFDNQASYAAVGLRIGRLPWLAGLVGGERAARAGQYVGDHLGGIMGNFLFGCMLGSTGVIGKILGLPIDIRHIAFSTANLGYALLRLDFALSWLHILWAVSGIALIGLMNLLVSFGLALRTALGARGVEFRHWGTLASAIWQRMRRSPRAFLVPPADAGASI
jgi:site-specific recombinase